MPSTRVKICGLNEADQVAAAVAAGAAYLGFNFFPKSPRYVTPQEAAALAVEVPPGVCKVALSVDPDDALLDEITTVMPVDMLQLHGHETPARVTEVKTRYGLPVMKVLGIAEAADVAQIDLYMGVADQILIDAKAPKGAVLPGGNGMPFDWRLLQGQRWTTPWMLAGGLTPDNVAEAVALTGAPQVDVSSGVESAPGVKDAAMMADFVAAVA
ncbi:Phosphoribosylanthranilate isomerase [Candidatus Rhodobacter oscarellae]|uniref:N-(5'-phosphoribosyl)anthranilate isomerase n=1 Tax=Candidatus Rhodobacter oscarellae TaxID=1675527 RepID=A0A0J9EAS9_9RHOB|nr:phosphoribosylanthranilate isomerase [Candidatus Rhodobacter lobularis]KMW59892.1 Phosphoribosylanthranilate isomerase [Candidatus Rhodobacter lobularis]